jgi:shikimate 5-dehydrogenase
MLAANASTARTPVLWKSALKKLSIEAKFDTIDLSAETSQEFEEVIDKGNYQVVILGHPNKMFANNIAIHPQGHDRRAGFNLIELGENCWNGNNFDGKAFFISLQEKFKETLEESLFIFIGSGSTAYACSNEVRHNLQNSKTKILSRQQLLNSDTSFLSLTNIDGLELRERKVILVNCTPIGKNGIRIPPNLLRNIESIDPFLIYDLNYYQGHESPWKQLKPKCEFQDGRRMNLLQAALGFHHIFPDHTSDLQNTLSLFETFQEE